MTTTRTRKPAAKKEPTERVLTLADLHVLTCDPCGATFTDPEMTTFPDDLKVRAYAAGWVIDGPWRVCPDCAPRWRLHEPDGVVARITAQMAGMEPDEAREMVAQAMLVHDEAAPAPAAEPGASSEPGTVDPQTSPALASMVAGYEAHGMRFPAKPAQPQGPVRFREPSNVVLIPPLEDDPEAEKHFQNAGLADGDCPELDEPEPEPEPETEPETALDEAHPLSVGDWKTGSDEKDGEIRND